MDTCLHGAYTLSQGKENGEKPRKTTISRNDQLNNTERYKENQTRGGECERWEGCLKTDHGRTAGMPLSFEPGHLAAVSVPTLYFVSYQIFY